jgi:hypothetical protein
VQAIAMLMAFAKMLLPFAGHYYHDVPRTAARMLGKFLATVPG